MMRSSIKLFNSIEQPTKRDENHGDGVCVNGGGAKSQPFGDILGRWGGKKNRKVVKRLSYCVNLFWFEPTPSYLPFRIYLVSSGPKRISYRRAKIEV